MTNCEATGVLPFTISDYDETIKQQSVKSNASISFANRRISQLLRFSKSFL
jgi:hypothetical protein